MIIETTHDPLISLQNANAGNEQVEEDVDIVGGNDPPVSNYPPVEIEKDAANRNSKCSSSSSSSSESGSSSSGLCYCLFFMFPVSQYEFILLIAACAPRICTLILFLLDGDALSYNTHFCKFFKSINLFTCLFLPPLYQALCMI